MFNYFVPLLTFQT